MAIIKWINNALGIDNTITVPILISLIVFIIGGLSKFIFEYIKVLLKRKNTRQRFSSLLNKVAKNLKDKERNTEKFYPTITIENTDGWKYTHKPISYLEIIYLIDFNEIHNSFYSKFRWYSKNNRIKKEEAFHNIWDTLSNIKFLESQLEINLSNLQNNYREFHDQYRYYLQEYQNYHERLLNEINNNLPRKDECLIEYLDSQERYWSHWTKLPLKERKYPHITYSTIINPMYKLNQKFPELPFVEQSGPLILQCEHNYAEMKNALEYSYNQFKGYSSQYKKSREKILSNIETIL